MTQPLSSAAQAVLSAASVAKDHARCPIAAALLAVADIVVPQGGPFLMTASEDRVRHQLLAIAAELEATNF